jgi:hypothetical protein
VKDYKAEADVTVFILWRDSCDEISRKACVLCSKTCHLWFQCVHILTSRTPGPKAARIKSTFCRRGAGKGSEGSTCCQNERVYRYWW